MTRALPLLSVLAGLLALWYAGAVLLNAALVRDQAARDGRALSTAALIGATWAQDKALLPAPHQILAEIWATTVEQRVTSKRSLVWHGWITLQATLLGFVLGTGLGVLLAIGIVHNRAMDLGMMPWIIASQTIPILAIAPMIIVVLYNVGVEGLVAKATISAYLSFFPVAVGMVKGLRSPDAMQLDQMRTWSASPAQVFWRLRLPASVPYLFASLKVAVAIALVGAIVGELPTGAQGGFGSRMLNGSYYGQTLIIWSALIGAAVCAGALVGLIGLVQRATLRRMGMA